MNDINTLRDSLFDTLKALKDEENPLDPAKAKAIVEVSQTIINTAKVENDYIKATGRNSASTFLSLRREMKIEMPKISKDDMALRKLNSVNRS